MLRLIGDRSVLGFGAGDDRLIGGVVLGIVELRVVQRDRRGAHHIRCAVARQAVGFVADLPEFTDCRFKFLHGTGVGNNGERDVLVPANCLVTHVLRGGVLHSPIVLNDEFGFVTIGRTKQVALLVVGLHDDALKRVRLRVYLANRDLLAGLYDHLLDGLPVHRDRRTIVVLARPGVDRRRNIRVLKHLCTRLGVDPRVPVRPRIPDRVLRSRFRVLRDLFPVQVRRNRGGERLPPLLLNGHNLVGLRSRREPVKGEWI